MEIHPPEGPLRSLRDFLAHLLTITVGILIALSLEAMVESFHHRSLVKEARENLRAEISTGRQDLRDSLDSAEALKGNIEAAITTLERLADGEMAGRKFQIGMRAASLDDTSWQTAQRTGAVSFMSYEEVKRYAGIYGLQAQYLAVQQKLVERILETDIRPGDAGVRAAAIAALRADQRSLDGLRQFGAALMQQYDDYLKAEVP